MPEGDTYGVHIRGTSGRTYYIGTWDHEGEIEAARAWDRFILDNNLLATFGKDLNFRDDQVTTLKMDFEDHEGIPRKKRGILGLFSGKLLTEEEREDLLVEAPPETDNPTTWRDTERIRTYMRDELGIDFTGARLLLLNAYKGEMAKREKRTSLPSLNWSKKALLEEWKDHCPHLTSMANKTYALKKLEEAGREVDWSNTTFVRIDCEPSASAGSAAKTEKVVEVDELQAEMAGLSVTSGDGSSSK